MTVQELMIKLLDIKINPKAKIYISPTNEPLLHLVEVDDFQVLGSGNDQRLYIYLKEEEET